MKKKLSEKQLDENRTKKLRNFQKNNIENKRCFDCKERGPQYICLDFNTFICTLCSGIQ